MSIDDTDPCEVCAREQARTLSTDFDGIRQICPRCGSFKLSDTASTLLRKVRAPNKRALLSGWVRDQNNSGAEPLITSHVLENVLNRPPPPVSERALAILREAARNLQGLGSQFNVREPRFLAASYSPDKYDVAYLVRTLEEEGLMSAVSLDGICAISPKGYIKLDESREHRGSSAHGFIAMWFDQSLNDAYENGFQHGVLNAGYTPLRIDRVEHVNRIDDEIIRQINSSRFVVADFTGHRGGVYFEAGYALGKAIPVFWTCRKSDMNGLHFDIRQFNCVDWETGEDLAKRLAARIEAVLGPGPTKLGY